ncbi:putative metal-dependent hydrolase [Candidatus Endolissoclinum faulkneri L5]|uniref:Endoribonuclease YbeY n=1 Tax=Candidatus Endolissoclinum faulkneri L5 TaxID=1401328 RepID=V9TUE0_9PROT|nr:rRNA maturation RNase YbeY [Candidatus Endolissoclinum faulkneri]AHC73303.1 putative metal-dependent hydrolase [Candidatus Endolissoclinum faulkneri L5]
MNMKNYSAEDDSFTRSNTWFSRNSKIILYLSTASPEWNLHIANIYKIAKQAIFLTIIHTQDDDDLEVSLLLTNDKEQRALNRKYRGNNNETNVLSFPTSFPQRIKPRPIGDISLAFETINREATEQNKTFIHHTSHLLVHGTLHLLGYDHQEEIAAKKMESREQKILNELGIANPYVCNKLDILP